MAITNFFETETIVFASNTIVSITESTVGDPLPTGNLVLPREVRFLPSAKTPRLLCKLIGA